jgi:hypothetical protein
MDQVAHIHGLDAVPTTQKDSIIAGQLLTQAYYENKHNLESPPRNSKVKIDTF